MAKRRSYPRTRTVYRSVKRGYRSRKGLLSGNIGNLLIGAIAGATSPMIPNIIGKWTKPVLFGVAGYALKKPALITIAGYELGRGFTMNGFSVGNGGNGNNGGFI